MKIGVIVIGLMILLASTAVVMGQGDPSRLFIEHRFSSSVYVS